MLTIFYPNAAHEHNHLPHATRCIHTHTPYPNHSHSIDFTRASFFLADCSDCLRVECCFRYLFIWWLLLLLPPNVVVAILEMYCCVLYAYTFFTLFGRLFLPLMAFVCAFVQLLCIDWHLFQVFVLFFSCICQCVCVRTHLREILFFFSLPISAVYSVLFCRSILCRQRLFVTLLVLLLAVLPIHLPASNVVDAVAVTSEITA